MHAGGFYMDSAARSDARNAHLADALGVTVVSVEYRLAPEHPWPAAPDDCEAAALWLVEEGGQVFGAEPMLIGGASAGATLAMTTLRRLRDRGLVERIVGAVLQFGAYDLSGQSPGGRLYADEWFIQAYAGHVPDRTHPDVHGHGCARWGRNVAGEPTGRAVTQAGLAPGRGEGGLSRH
jgi:acetyl esterase